MGRDREGQLKSMGSQCGYGFPFFHLIGKSLSRESVKVSFDRIKNRG